MFVILIDLVAEERGKLVRWFGIDRNKRSGGGDFRMEPDIPEYGFKYHMNDINAQIGAPRRRRRAQFVGAQFV